MDELKIFIATHKKITNSVPTNRDIYIICPQNHEIKDNRLPLLYIDDYFTEQHKTSYGEGCLMHYLWKHQEILPKYVGLCHYRRFFEDFREQEQWILPTLKEYKAIILNPFRHPLGDTNYTIMRRHHFLEDCNLIDKIIKENYSDYYNAWKEMNSSCFQYPCNMFIMKKEDFIELCEFVFGVITKFDEINGLKNDRDVEKYVIKQTRKKPFFHGSFKWQKRLNGFYLEWLTETFFYYKFGIDNCYCSMIENLSKEIEIKRNHTNKISLKDIKSKYHNIYC